jgi:hypothetical protein
MKLVVLGRGKLPSRVPLITQLPRSDRWLIVLCYVFPLCVSEPLDVLEQWVVSRFTQVKDTGRAYDLTNREVIPFRQQELVRFPASHQLAAPRHAH